MKKNISRKYYRYWLIFYLNVFLILGIFIFILLIASHNNIKFDLTPNKKHTLPSEVRHVLQSIKQDIKFTVFYKKGNKKRYEDLFTLLSSNSDHISYRLFSLDANPGMARIYGVSNYGQTVLEIKDKKYLLNAGKQNTIFKTLAKIARPDRHQSLYFTVGHGEVNFYENCTELQESLQLMGIAVKTINLAIQSKIPANASALIVAGPIRDFLPREMKSLNDYIQSGGQVIFMLEPFTKLPKIYKLLGDYNLTCGQGIIIDNQNRLYNHDVLTPFIPSFSRGPITQSLRAPAIFPTSTYFNLADKNDSRKFIQYIAKSSSQSWSVENKEQIKAQNYQFQEPSSQKGPLTVSVLASRKSPDRSQGKVICFGDSDFIQDHFLRMYSNKELFLNTLKWILAQTEANQDLFRTEQHEFPFHHMSQYQAKWAFLIPVVFMPLSFLILGVVVYLFRRLRS